MCVEPGDEKIFSGISCGSVLKTMIMWECCLDPVVIDQCVPGPPKRFHVVFRVPYELQQFILDVLCAVVRRLLVGEDQLPTCVVSQPDNVGVLCYWNPRVRRPRDSC